MEQKLWPKCPKPCPVDDLFHVLYSTFLTCYNGYNAKSMNKDRPDQDGLFAYKKGLIAMTIGQIIKRKQPNEYALLMSWIYIDQAEDTDKAMREIERLMRHDAYVRERGAIRQIRHGD